MDNDSRSIRRLLNAVAIHEFEKKHWNKPLESDSHGKQIVVAKKVRQTVRCHKRRVRGTESANTSTKSQASGCRRKSFTRLRFVLVRDLQVALSS